MSCDFEIAPSYNCLFDHCKIVHKWTNLPCLIDGCQFIAHNSYILAKHKKSLHTNRNKSYAPKAYACTWKNCHSSFAEPAKLRQHLDIHENIMHECIFCPYRNNRAFKLGVHYRHHYKVFDFECEFCKKKFADKDNMATHIKRIHAVETKVYCPVCDHSGLRHAVGVHINRVHKLLSKWNKEKKQFDVYKP